MNIDAPAPVRDQIFISYRHDDAPGASGRIYDWLPIAFGADRVFRDQDNLRAGKWLDQIDAVLTRSAACVVVIGPHWASAKNISRLRNEDDAVSHELRNALRYQKMTVIPTLLDRAKRPKATNLPSELHEPSGTLNSRRPKSWSRRFVKKTKSWPSWWRRHIALKEEFGNSERLLGGAGCTRPGGRFYSRLVGEKRLAH